MRYLLTGYVFFAAFIAFSQDMVSGRLLDSATSEPVPFAHVSNFSDGGGSITRADGSFNILATVGDTLVFSIVGYETLGWIVDKSWFSGRKNLLLPQDTLLLQDVTVYDIPPEAIFKQRILDYQPQDTSFWYHGMPEPKTGGDPMLTEKTLNNPLFAITHPTDFLYHKFSKREKEKRTYHKVTQRQSRERIAYAKFNREWVKEVTRLEGDELTDFIQFCDFSLDYLEKTPQYIIREELLARLVAFKREGKG